jgi:hypothetical protein
MQNDRILLEGFNILTEYECGRAMTSIEWVARSEKPIVEIGGRPIEGCSFSALADDLNRCISQSREEVRGFIIPDKMRGYCSYGFFKHRWAIDALLDLWGKRKSGLTRTRRLLWMQGLVFGYSPDAIQRFIESGSPVPTAIEHQDHRTIRRVEIYVPAESRVRARSRWNDRCQRHG